MPEQEPDRITRVIDFRIPLTWLLTGVAAVSWALVSMWFSVAQLVGTVNDLQITVKSGNTSVVAVSGELALLKFRLTNVEDSVKRVADDAKIRGGK